MKIFRKLKNKKNAYIIVGILIFSVAIISVSYAIFNVVVYGNKNNTIKAGKLSLTMDEKTSEGIKLINAVPVSDETGLKNDPYEFTLTNNGSINSDYSIYLDDINSDSDAVHMSSDYIKYELRKGNDVTTGILSSMGTNPNCLINEGSISSNESIDYSLKLWINQDAGNEVMNTEFSGVIRVEATQSNYFPKKVTVSMPNNTQNERNFTWHTKSSNLGSDIQIIKATSSKSNVNFDLINEKLEYSGSVVDKTLDLYVHQVKATNLEAGNKYFYRVGDKLKNSWSNIGEFVTDDGDDNFSFIYVADQQTSSTGSSKSLYTMQQAKRKNPNAEFIMNAGDLLNNPTNKDEWINNLSFDIYGNNTAVNTAGNHDYQYTSEGVTNSLANHFYYDTVNGEDKTSGVYYSFDYGNTHITVLNTNSNWYGDLDYTQLNWLKNDLATSSKQHKIVLMHRGIYTTGPHYYYYRDIQSLTNQLTSVMSDYNVDLILQGHDHTYALTYPLNSNGERQEYVTSYVYSNETDSFVSAMNTNSPVYFIGGTAGTKYEPKLIKSGNNYVVDPTFNSSYTVNVDNETLDNYFNKFQLVDTPRENNTNLAMFSSVSINGDDIVVNSYTVDNQNSGLVKLYNDFAIKR